MKSSFFTIALLFCSSSLTDAAPLGSKRSLSSCYKQGSSELTYYWIPKEGDGDMNNHGKTVQLTGSKTETLVDSNNKVIAKVSKATKDKFKMEGTGLLENGMLLNLGESTDVYMKLDRSETPYGVGSNGHALTPWVSVASNDITVGTTLYVKELDGVELPNGETHNGCVRVDDESWSFDGCQLDFFILQYSAYKDMMNKVSGKITAVDKSCSIKNYVTGDMKHWANL